MYEVVVRFRDLQDGGHIYNVGDEFPHDGKRVTKKRLAELSGKNNRRGVQLIKEIKTKEVENNVGEIDGDVPVSE